MNSHSLGQNRERRDTTKDLFIDWRGKHKLLKFRFCQKIEGRKGATRDMISDIMRKRK